MAFHEPGDKPEEMFWDGAFQPFEDRKPAFLHQARPKGGEPGRSFGLVSRER